MTRRFDRRRLTPVLAAGALGLSMNGALAYDLVLPCKATAGWKVVSGSCDNQGLLQGDGAATLDSVNGVRPRSVFHGRFVDGLPDGPIELRFERNGRCTLNFVRGRVNNSELQCTRGGITLRTQPGAGKAVWEVKPLYGDKTVATLTLDLPTVDINGSFEYVREAHAFAPLVLPGSRSVMEGSARGTADLLVLSVGANAELAIKVTNFALQYTSPRGDMSGTLQAKCFGTYGCELEPFKVKRSVGAVDARGLLTVKPAGAAATQLVFAEDEHAHPELLYFKDATVEFDASQTRQCNSEFRRGAYLRQRQGAGRYEIEPACGKVTTPNGQSFEGFFRRGQPVLP